MEQLFAQIIDTVDKEVEQTVQRATRVAEREKQHAAEEAEQILAARKEALERELRVREERAVARLRAEIRWQELAQRQAFVEQLFARTLARLKGLPRDERYRAWLRALLARGVSQFGGAPVVVACNAQDRNAVSAALAGTNAQLAPEAAPITCGVILRSADGRLSIDCSGEAELVRAQEQWRDEVLARLQLPDMPGAAKAGTT